MVLRHLAERLRCHTSHTRLGRRSDETTARTVVCWCRLKVNPSPSFLHAAFIMIKIHIDNIDNIKLSNVILDMEKNYPRFQPIIPAHLGWRSKPDLDERL